ncbi:CRISPR-associated protein Cas5 [Clostridium estertheticum]|uniref:CRISPR-associated protein Cas5 n=1 Tax=Clostridium estertheticum TaxID=238834 RepID=UPI001C0BE728|nr:CRISPR-associated protein Cas5 [Clostridium estertheticum]MBU3218180.1 CRISPR-associated protein Cas5 [Clostridium estertheticum]WAG55869.1 CRISPR-associated protein Cas5 [Clostridium estertheticum]
MEVLRIILTQSSANYKKEETVLNKMTYPLPPFSTIIGALHSACGYKEYHPMDISIQGKYEAMHKEPYTDYCFLNSIMDDRGILVKMRNEVMLSTAFDKVAKAKKPQGNSFRKGITIDVLNGTLLEEYRGLKDLTEKIAEFKINRIDKVLELTKKRKKTLMDKKKKYKEDLQECQLISKREKEIKELEKTVKERFKDYKKKEYEIPYSRFASLTTSLKYYEVLNNIKLILHIKSDRNTLDEIKDNIYNLKSIGRSEDFVDVREACFIDVVDSIEEGIYSDYSAYINYDLIKNKKVFLRLGDNISANGTKYYLNKNYIIEDNKRIFKKKKVVYTSEYSAEEGCDTLYFDISKEKSYIVNFN